jgi:hypothetical protein
MFAATGNLYSSPSWPKVSCCVAAWGTGTGCGFSQFFPATVAFPEKIRNLWRARGTAIKTQATANIARRKIFPFFGRTVSAAPASSVDSPDM